MMRQKKYIQLKKLYQSTKGFTLIELFVAITIFSFIALSLILTLGIAVKAYKISKEFENENNILKSIIYNLKEELNSSVPELENDKILYGTATSLYFCAPNNIDKEKYPLYKITYEIKKAPQQGLYFIKKLENPFAHFEEYEDEKIKYEKNLQYTKIFSYYLINSEQISFEYLNIVKDKNDKIIFNWTEEWNFNYMPSAIKINIKNSKKKEETILIKLKDFSGTDIEKQIEKEENEEEE